MSLNYADTVSMYIDCPNGLTLLNTPNLHWIYLIDANDSNFNNYHIRLDKLYVRYFSNIFGHSRLFVTFSLPKLLSNSNVFNITNFDENACYNHITNKLRPFIDLTGLPAVSFNDWQVSRIDLFIMHPINTEDRSEYEETYSTLRLGNYIPYKYENTIYLNSILRPDKAAGKVFRAYPKFEEVRYRNKIDYPDYVNKDHEECLQLSDLKLELYRFEFMLRRHAIRYECKKYNLPTTVHNSFDEDIQKQIINNMIRRIGLHLNILSKREFIRLVDHIFKTNATNQNVKIFARLIRNKSSPKGLNKNQIYYIRRILRENGTHIVTSKYICLKPVKMLK